MNPAPTVSGYGDVYGYGDGEASDYSAQLGEATGFAFDPVSNQYVAVG
jgi:hypothetical protein